MYWNPPYNSAVVIANGDPPSSSLLHSLTISLKTVIAVDGGVSSCIRLNVRPHLITGDFDSVDPEHLKIYGDVPQLEMSDQNKTDLEKALEFLEAYDFKTIYVCGALGKRIDHTLANISLLSRYPAKVFYITEEEICMSLPLFYELSCIVGERISLFPLGLVKRVSTSGLKWNLCKRDLDAHFLPVSNICIEEKVAISFEKGHLILSRQFIPFK